MKITIRLAERRDVPAMLAIYAPFVQHTATSFEFEVPSEADFWARVQSVLAEAPWLVCTIGEEVVAYAYAGSHRSRAAYHWNREVSVYVREDFRGKGVGGALYRALFAGLRWQGYVNALAGIVLPNEASVGFHEGVGFRLIGIYHRIGYKLDRYWNMSWWERPLQEASYRPGPVKKLEALVQTEEWAETIAKTELEIRLLMEG